MKAFQKILAIALALIMSLSVLGTVAFADEGATTGSPVINENAKGSITVYKYEYNGTNNNKKGTGLENESGNLPKDKGALDDPSKTAIALEGVTFKIYQVKNTADTIAYYNGAATESVTVASFLDDNGKIKSDYSEYTGYENGQTTGENGKVVFDNLPVGMYVIVESAAPENVTKAVDPFLVSIPMTHPTNLEEWMYDVYVYPKNSTSEGNVTLNKTDKDGNGIDDVNFTLAKQDGSNWVLVEETKDDTTFTTKNGGKIEWTGLAFGTYRITETSAPAGYIVDTNPIQFVIDENSKITCSDSRVTVDGNESAALTITLVNEKPDMTKKIVEGTTPVDETNAGVGSTVNYQITVDVPKNITKMETFTLTDTPTNLNVDNSTIAIKYIDDNNTEQALSFSAYSVSEDDTNASIVEGFTITFTPSQMSAVAGKQIVVTYNAVVLASAATEGKAPNTANLTYSSNIDSSSNTPNDGDNWYQIEDQAIVYTYKIVVDKKADSADGKAMPNVEFELYNSNDEKIHVINTGAADADGNKPNGNYRLATATENADGTKTYETGSTTTLITGVDGKITVTGLNSGTYTLKEIKTAEGYNLLSGTVDVNLNIDTKTVWNTEETFKNGVWQKKVSVKQTTYTGGEDSDNNNFVTKTIVNKQGFNLPATGGIGTLMFIIIGGVLMAGGICLIVPNKKRAV